MVHGLGHRLPDEVAYRPSAIHEEERYYTGL